MNHECQNKIQKKLMIIISLNQLENEAEAFGKKLDNITIIFHIFKKNR